MNILPDKLTIDTIVYLRKKFERDNWQVKTEENWYKYLNNHFGPCRESHWRAMLSKEPVNY